LNLGIAAHGSLRFGPTLLFLESDELRGKALSVGEDGREVRSEVPASPARITSPCGSSTSAAFIQAARVLG
jgi:hypothetical protein